MRNLVEAAAGVLNAAMAGQHGGLARIAANTVCMILALTGGGIVLFAFSLPLFWAARLLDGATRAHAPFRLGEVVVEAVVLPLAWRICRFVWQNDPQVRF